MGLKILPVNDPVSRYLSDASPLLGLGSRIIKEFHLSIKQNNVDISQARSRFFYHTIIGGLLKHRRRPVNKTQNYKFIFKTSLGFLLFLILPLSLCSLKRFEVGNVSYYKPSFSKSGRVKSLM